MIKSKDNSKVKEYSKLSAKRSYREQQGKFAVEGVRIISDALSSGIKFDFVLLTENCLDKISGTGYDLTKLCDYELVSEKIAKSISQVETPQGAFGVANKASAMQLGEINSGDYLVALYDVQDPGNVGTLIRTADAFGFDKVVVSKGCDVYNPKVVRSTMGSLFRISILECSDFESLLNGAKVRSYATVVSEEATAINEISFDGGMLVIGNEAKGLPEEIYSKCDEQVTINMYGGAESLNAAVAGGICMYHMRQDVKGNLNE